MISKKAIAPLVMFCIWNLIISAFGLVVASNLVLGFSLIGVLCMLSTRVRRDLLRQKKQLKQLKVLDDVAHVVLIIWMLSWLWVFPTIFWTYATATLILNLYVWTHDEEVH